MTHHRVHCRAMVDLGNGRQRACEGYPGPKGYCPRHRRRLGVTFDAQQVSAVWATFWGLMTMEGER